MTEHQKLNIAALSLGEDISKIPVTIGNLFYDYVRLRVTMPQHVLLQGLVQAGLGCVRFEPHAA